MNKFFWNLVLALVWVALTQDYATLNFLAGFLLAALLLILAEGKKMRKGYGRQVFLGVLFAGFYVKEVFLSSARVALDVLSPTPGKKAAVIGVPLDPGHSAGSITLLANLITMTPGTMSLDVSKDRRWLYIHAMFVDDVDAFRVLIKEGFERRVLEVFR